MDVNDLRKLFEKSNNRFAIFEDLELLKQYKMSNSDLLMLINDFLNDKEKAKLFELPHFKTLNSRGSILKLIRDCDVLMELLNRDDMVGLFQKYEIKETFKALDNNDKVQILLNPDFLKKCGFIFYDISDLIKSLSDDKKEELLRKRDFLEQELELDSSSISNIIASIKNEEEKMRLADYYEYKGIALLNILDSLSDEKKKAVLFENKYMLRKYEIIGLIRSFSMNSLIEFLGKGNEFLKKNNINPYEIICSLSTNIQLDFVSRIEETNLSIDQKRAIFVTLSSETKDKIDLEELPEEYKSAIELKVCRNTSKTGCLGKIIVDLNGDLEKYKGLDKLLYINPMEIPADDKPKLLRLFEICPKLGLSDNIGLSPSSIEEYISGEEWIESILKQIDESWSDIQKTAFIDNAVGNKISYASDFGTEVSNQDDVRALWKIIHTGYGVCNGIAQVEQYILNKIGIKTEIVSSNRHSFLIVKGINIPTSNGDNVFGDTILDPTWNLTAHKYGAMPQNFCKSYEEIRKNDVGDNGIDSEAHKLSDEQIGATLNLDEQSLRNLYASIGIADKDGNFPIKDLSEKLEKLFQVNLPSKKILEMVLFYFETMYPDFAKFQNSTSSVLSNFVLNQDVFQYDRCVINRVYDRDDEKKSPLLYVYVDYGEQGKRFYYADKDRKSFIEMKQEEFEKRFECYEADLEKQNGKRPWENNELIEKHEDLTTSSGKIVSRGR